MEQLRSNIISLFLAYIVFINIVGFAYMGIDKFKASMGSYRIPEKKLFTLALMGGAIGTNLGMRFFRHKTLHLSFVFGMPAILVIEIAFLYGIFGR